VARAAERDGVTLRVVNFGERGYTAFQEFLLLDQELGARPAPDLVVFFDGHNEFGVRTQNDDPPPDQPAVFQQETIADAFERARPLPGQVPPPEPSLWREYLDTGAASRIWRGMTGAIVPPAAAQEGAPFRPPTPAQYADAFEVYARAVELATWTAGRHGTRVEFFWQPSSGDNDPVPKPDLTGLLPPVVHDIRDTFDGHADDAVFIDGGHSNELGARLLGEAIWQEIAPALR
jgi:lysophospholipase L1-like esterase